jgi:hypothetical protein
VSLTELRDRVTMAQQVAYQFDPMAKAELQRLYGLSEGTFTAYALDPGRATPLIERQVRASLTSGIAGQTGFGVLDRQMAEQLAQMNVDEFTARRGFTELAQSQELMAPLPGERPGTISRQQQVGAVFGQEAANVRAIEQRRGERQAIFKEGGGFATSREGFTGVGSL